MFATWMTTAWEAGTIVGVVAGVIGFFTVVRGSSFAAHAVPNSAFAGAAAAVVFGTSQIVGLAVFALGGALLISALTRWSRRDVATALAIVLLLALGDLFLTRTNGSETLLSDLFGTIYGVAPGDLISLAVVGITAVLVALFAFRPLLLGSVSPEVAQARGVSPFLMEATFMCTVALTSAIGVPVVGALLVFALLVGPPAIATQFTQSPGAGLLASVALAVATVWASIALSFVTNAPMGFFVGAIGAAGYLTTSGTKRLLGARFAFG